MDNVIINKAETIERCIQRIRQEYKGSEEAFAANYTKQDAILLNLQRACETAIDMATHVVRLKHLGVPQSSREEFVLLERAKIIPKNLSDRLQKMVGFRNIAIHDYAELNLEIVRSILENYLDDFLTFNRVLLSLPLP